MGILEALVQLRSLRAELSGSLAQATLSLQGEASRSTQKMTPAPPVRSRGQDAGARHWPAHTCTRRTAPGPWEQGKLPTEQIQMLIGHKNKSTTEIYIKHTGVKRRSRTWW